MHNLNPGSSSDNAAEKLKLTTSQPCYILLSFAFSLSAFLLCAQYSQIRSHALRHALSIPCGELSFNPRIAQPIIRQLDSPVVRLCCSSPKKKVQSFQAQSKTVSGQASSPSHSLRLHVVGCHLPYPLQPASPTTCKQLSVSPFHSS